MIWRQRLAGLRGRAAEISGRRSAVLPRSFKAVGSHRGSSWRKKLTAAARALVGFLCVTTAAAQSPPKITSISREWIQRGNSAEVVIEGENFGAAAEFLISGEPGVSAEPVSKPPPALKVESTLGGISMVAEASSKSLTAQLSARAGASLGPRELRVVTPAGVSNPVRIHIGYLPELDEKQPNPSLAQAQVIPLPAALTGTIGNAAEVDSFRFRANPGEQLLFEIQAARVGSRLDSSLAIVDAAGKELARSEDAFGLDSFLVFTVPSEGEYGLQVRDFRFQGGKEFRYRLLAGALPHVTSIFPFGGQRGRNVELQIKGHNLDGLSKLALRIETNAPLGRQEIRLDTPKGVSNLLPFDVGDAPEFLEQEPNNAADRANEVPLPITINGRIDRPAESDVFKFSAQKNQQLVFEILAHRFYSPLDALLTLTDAAGKVLQRNDDAAGADARIEHKFAEAGQYFIRVEDLLKRGSDHFGYRLSIRQPKPDFTVRFLPDNPRVPRGGHVPIRCELTRLNGFNEIVRLAAKNLPAGLHAEPLILAPSDPASGFLVLSATEASALGPAPLQVEASSVLDGRPVARQAEPIFDDKPVLSAFVTVLDAVPFTIEVATRSLTMDQGQSGIIEAVAHRRAGFAGEIKVSAEGFSAGRDPISKNFEVQEVTLTSGQTRASLRLTARLNAETGTRAVVLKGESKWRDHTVTQFSTPLPVAVQQVPFALSATLKRLSITALPASSASAAREALFALRAERRGGFTNEIELKLDGLPEGITAEISNVSAGAAETPVKLVASENAKPAKDLALVISASAWFRDRIYRQQITDVKLTVNAPEETPDLKTAEAK